MTPRYSGRAGRSPRGPAVMAQAPPDISRAAAHQAGMQHE